MKQCVEWGSDRLRKTGVQETCSVRELTFEGTVGAFRCESATADARSSARVA